MFIVVGLLSKKRTKKGPIIELLRTYIILALLDVEQAWTSVFYLKSFDMDSVQVGKAVFVKEINTTLGIEPRTFSFPGSYSYGSI